MWAKTRAFVDRVRAGLRFAYTPSGVSICESIEPKRHRFLAPKRVVRLAQMFAVLSASLQPRGGCFLKLSGCVLSVVLCTCGCSVSREQEAHSAGQPIQPVTTFFVPVSITKFSSIHSPCIDVEIGENTLSMELDLGSQGDLVVTGQSIDRIAPKVLLRKKQMYGIRGKQYPTTLYRVPKAKIGRMTFFEPVVQEEAPELIQDSTFVQSGAPPSPRESGRLGWELFYNVNLLVDVTHSQIAFCDSLETLVRQGYATETFAKTPLLLQRGLVELEVNTSEGIVRCMLDTGATWNVFNSDMPKGQSIDQAVWETDNVLEYPSFTIGGYDFGPIAFRRVPIQLPIHIEAILGMEFFQNHLVFLDFAAGYAYLSKKRD